MKMVTIHTSRRVHIFTTPLRLITTKTLSLESRFPRFLLKAYNFLRYFKIAWKKWNGLLVRCWGELSDVLMFDGERCWGHMNKDVLRTADWSSYLYKYSKYNQWYLHDEYCFTILLFSHDRACNTFDSHIWFPHKEKNTSQHDDGAIIEYFIIFLQQ